MRRAHAALATEREGTQRIVRRRRDATPVAGFRKWLLVRYGKGKLSAKDVCLAAAECSGRDLDVDDLAIAGDRRGGHYQRKLDNTLGIASWIAESVYWVQVPYHDCRTNLRVFRKHPMLLVHERVSTLFLKDVETFLPPTAEREVLFGLPRFRSCPLLRELGWERLALLGFYIDAYPFTKSDSCYAFYWNGIFMRQRHLITVFRKSDLCKCGCGGRCSLQAILEVVVWSFVILRTGVYPTQWHDHTKLDAHRLRTRQGQLPVRGLLREMRADWEELAVGLGFKTWSSSEAPCFECDCTALNMHVYATNEAEQPYKPHNKKTTGVRWPVLSSIATLVRQLRQPCKLCCITNLAPRLAASLRGTAWSMA